MTRFVAGALCATMVACGAPAPSSSSPPAATSFALSGRTIDASTNSPFAGAAVEVLDGPNRGRFAASDATGAFRIADLAMGGLTVRAGHAGYDSAYLGVTLVRDTSVDLQLTLFNTTLGGTWAGFVSFSPSTGSPQSVTVLQATFAQTGASVSSDMFSTSGPYQAGFSGTLQNPSAIGSTTGITGTLTLVEEVSVRGPTTCRGTGTFTGTINWKLMDTTAPQIVFDCGGTFTNVRLALVRRE